MDSGTENRSGIDTPAYRARPHAWMLGALIVVLAAFAFRLCCLEEVPPGLQVDDERWNFEIVDQVRQGEWQLFYTTGWGREGAFYYLAALWTSLLGENYLLLRLLPVWAGTLTVALTIRLGGQMFNRRVGLVAGAGVAFSMWALFYSRIIFRATILPPVLLAALSVLWDGLEGKGRRWFVWTAFGVLYALAFYVYTAARMLPFLFLAFGLYLLAWHHDLFRTRARGLLWSFGLAALLLLPLLWTLLRLDQGAVRLDQVGRPIQDLGGGDIGRLWEAVTRTLGMFFLRGSTSWRYNWAGRPVLDPLGGALLVLGLGAACWRWRRAPFALLLLWWGSGLIPGFLSVDAPSLVRTLMSMPATYVLIGVAIDQLGWGARGAITAYATGRSRAALASALAGVYLLLAAGLTWRDYFVRWPVQPEVREIYQFTLTQAARFAEEQAAETPVAMSGVLDADRDPYSVAHIRRSPGWAPRWFDGRYALLLPPGSSTLVIPEYVPLADPLLALISPAATSAASPFLTPDGRPILTSYQGALQEAARQRLVVPAASARWDGAGGATGDRVTLPVDVGDVLALVGYEVQGPAVRGAPLQVLSAWQVQHTSPEPWVIFLHLVDAQGVWVSGFDRLDVDPASWRTGDLVVQMHQPAIPADMAPGPYLLRVGVYHRETMQRLSFHVGPGVLADSLVLAVLEIE